VPITSSVGMTSVPLAAFGPGVRGFTAIQGAAPVVVDGDRVVLPGDGPAALAAVVS
jgi:hypothetical protein